MYVPELPSSDVPTYVVIASRGPSILAFDHMDDLGGALMWCGRAMRAHSRADQVAIARPTYVEWPTIGRMWAVMPFEGWVRELDGWHHAGERELQRFFETVPAEPCSLSGDPAPATGVIRSHPSLHRETASPLPHVSVMPLTRVTSELADVLSASTKTNR